MLNQSCYILVITWFVLCYNRLCGCRSLPRHATAVHRFVSCPPAAPHLGPIVVLQGITYVCGCWPSCHWFGVYVVVSHRAIGLLQVLVTSPCKGGAAKIYNWHYYIPLLQERLLQRSFPTVLDSSLCRTARSNILHPSFYMMFVYHVT